MFVNQVENIYTLISIKPISKNSNGRRIKLEKEIKLFEGNQIRSVWNNEKEEWYFSVVDIVGVLSESENSNNYWKVLKKRLKSEGSELVTYCNQLKLKSPKDIKMYKTDVVEIFHIIKSILLKTLKLFKMC